MPRNPNKTRCQVPDCSNWAMRGQARCRVHLNSELGPRGGAPRGNLNALSTGGHAHPLPYGDLQSLAHDLAIQPAQLPALLNAAIQSIHGRAGDPFKTLRALAPLLSELLPLVAESLYAAELDALLQQLSPRQQATLQSVLWRHTHRFDSETRLIFFRRIANHSNPQKDKCTGKTTNGTGLPLHSATPPDPNASISTVNQ